MTEDSSPPSGPRDTDPAPPNVDLVPAIRAGEAQLAVSQALDALMGAVLRLEGVSVAVARALDATAGDGR